MSYLDFISPDTRPPRPAAIRCLADAGALVEEYFPICPRAVSRRVDQLLLLADDTASSSAEWY